MDEHISEKITQLSSMQSKVELVEAQLKADKSKFESGELFTNIKAGKDAIDKVDQTLSEITRLNTEMDNLMNFFISQQGQDWEE